jgi:hypothetical protein
MKVNTALALALVNATAKTLKTKGDKPDNWVARAVVDRVDHTDLGVRRVPSILVQSSKGVMIRK